MDRRLVLLARGGIILLVLIFLGGIREEQAEVLGAHFVAPSFLPGAIVPIAPLLATAADRSGQINVAYAPAPTPATTWNPPGYVMAPILLYHHVSDSSSASRYYVSPEQFEEEMQALQDWGYHSISISKLIDAMLNGAELPPHPIVITFDDGDLSIYENAFPIMEAHGFDGVFYIVSSYLGAHYFVSLPQLHEMAAAGWEIGCHSADHADLTQAHSQLRAQVLESRAYVEDQLGVRINTFAYPFGCVDSEVVRRLVECGYLGAVGLGTSYEHTPETLYYLSRIEVHGGIDLELFAALLPWSAPVTADSVPTDQGFAQVR